MSILNNAIFTMAGHAQPELIIWDEKYDTGITLVDNQHRELVGLINELHRACRSGEEVGLAFKDAMHRMVEYVHFHFSAEQQILRNVKYPGYQEHLKEHDILIKDILGAARDFDEGKRFVPQKFLRTLRDWLLGHIGVSDRQYAIFVADQKRKGLLHDH